MIVSDTELSKESHRLFESLQPLGWTLDECSVYAPMTLEINKLKKNQGAIILAHNYQTPDIVYGVADFVGDSYGLSKKAAENPSQKIIFCSVSFMGETAKIMNPEKEVLVPSRAGCSLADSITAKDVKTLKAQHPGIPVACYINSSAEVKAESDVCVTSSNVMKIIESLPGKEVIFIPDKYMADYIRRTSQKKIISWEGVCIVHEEFTKEQIEATREENPGVEILVHPECSASVIDEANFVGSTSQILNEVEHSKKTSFMIVSECGLTDRIKAEHPEKQIVGACSLCPYMKSIELKDILQALKNPEEDQMVTLSEDIMKKAKKSIDKMFELSEEKERNSSKTDQN